MSLIIPGMSQQASSIDDARKAHLDRNAELVAQLDNLCRSVSASGIQSGDAVRRQLTLISHQSDFALQPHAEAVQLLMLQPEITMVNGKPADLVFYRVEGIGHETAFGYWNGRYERAASAVCVSLRSVRLVEEISPRSLADEQKRQQAYQFVENIINALDELGAA